MTRVKLDGGLEHQQAIAETLRTLTRAVPPGRVGVAGPALLILAAMYAEHSGMSPDGFTSIARDTFATIDIWGHFAGIVLEEIETT